MDKEQPDFYSEVSYFVQELQGIGLHVKYATEVLEAEYLTQFNNFMDLDSKRLILEEFITAIDKGRMADFEASYPELYPYLSMLSPDTLSAELQDVVGKLINIYQSGEELLDSVRINISFWESDFENPDRFKEWFREKCKPYNLDWKINKTINGTDPEYGNYTFYELDLMSL